MGGEKNVFFKQVMLNASAWSTARKCMEEKSEKFDVCGHRKRLAREEAHEVSKSDRGFDIAAADARISKQDDLSGRFST